MSASVNAIKPDLVIGAVRGYKFEQLRPFVVSLKRSGFQGDLVFLWNSLADETRAELERHGAKLVHFDYRGSGSLNSWSRFWSQIRPLLRLPVGNSFRTAVYKKILNLAFVRYLHALDFLEQNRGRYRNVFLTDVRDVIFQDDPFCDQLPGDMAAFLEEPHMRYGHEPMNDGWLLENYGPEMTAKLKDARISCCGTVMGTEAGMVRYLRAFVAEILRLRSVAHGADTSVHNVLLHERLSGKISVIENFQGAVGTVNSDALDKLTVGASGLVVGIDKRVVPVLHQYDRDLKLAAGLVERLTGSSTKSN
jgi:hypothetical protein